MSDRPDKKHLPPDMEVSDRDIYEAMKDIPGYLDITAADFRELYRVAYRHALERLSRSIRARDIMTGKPVSVKRETPLRDVAKLMAERGVAGVPVTEDDGRVAGVISEKDFLSRMGGGDTQSFMAIVAQCLKGKGCVALPIRAKKAEDIMTTPAVTVNEDATVLDIAALFKKKNINRVPVVDREGRLTGIVSRADIVGAPLISGL